MFGVWWKSSSRLVGGRRTRNLILGLAGIGLIAWFVVSSAAIGNDFALRDGSQTATRLFESLVVLTVVAGWIIAAVTNLYLPSGTVVDTIVAVMPVTRFQRALSLRLAASFLTLAASLLTLSPLIWPLLYSIRDHISLAIGAATLIVTMAIGVVLAQVTLLASVSVHRRVLRGATERAVEERSGAISAGLAFLVLASSYSGMGADGEVSRPTSWLAAAATASARVEMLGMLGTLAALGGVIILLLLLVSLVSRSIELSVDRTPTSLVLLNMRVNGAATLPTLEVAVWVRNRYNRSTIIAFLAASVGSVIWRLAQPDSAQVVLLATSLLSIAALVGASAYGETRSWHWLYAVLGRPSAWVGPKMAGTLVVWIAFVVPAAMVGSVVGAWSTRDVLIVSAIASLQLFAVLMVGLFVPTSSQHSIQSLGNFFLSIAVSIVILPIILSSSLAGDSTVALVIIGVLMGSATVLMYWVRAVRAPTKPLVTVA